MKVTTTFHVNEKKRTIVCIIRTYDEVPLRLIKYGVPLNNRFSPYEECEYVGKAKCAPEDIWDENYGRKLAEYRAMEIRRKDVNKRIDAYLNYVTKALSNLNTYGKIKTSRPPQIPEATKA